jgi:hypothetical protein
MCQPEEMMMNLWLAALLTGLLVATPTERLVEARTRADDANFQNDAAALRKAAADLVALADDREVGRMALYYASWTEWALAASEVQAGNSAAGIQAADRSAFYARRALERDENDAEVMTMLVNALIVIAVLDKERFMPAAKEIAPLRARAIERAPASPRVVMMDAGMIFNNPPERGGGREKGLARWLEAIRLFERESESTPSDVTRPTWGRALAWGWLTGLYLAMMPPEFEKAREAAMTALKLRPDFWFVKDQLVPKLAK